MAADVAESLGRDPEAVVPTARLARDIRAAARGVADRIEELRGLSPLWMISGVGLTVLVVESLNDVLRQTEYVGVPCRWKADAEAIAERHVAVFAAYCIRLAGDEKKARSMLQWTLGRVWAVQMWSDALAGKYVPAQHRIARCEREWIMDGAKYPA